MAITTLCAVVATLRVLPDRTQFFQYESVSLSCEQQGNSSDWTVKRNTTTTVKREPSGTWNNMNESHRFIDVLYPLDTGVYWCESAAGECSNTVNIFVTAGSVILDSPVLPVMAGDAVTLSCRTMTTFPNLTADFYKDGLLIGSSSTGNMTIHSVSLFDEGFYKCGISGAGESPDSWLTVRGSRPELPDSPITHIILPVVGACLSLVSLVCVMLLCLWRNHKGKVDPDVPYTDVTITQEVQPNRIRDVEAAPTFYSTVKPGNT
ncbi:uncharacterized protein LOC117245954 isoform X2 [Epinephelus lanceolatus]|uniref:uncharacterized protein LOC117245954 n=1 Tax=Epinephelus lanceolatus TaxID=310571 RepID=UPI001447DB74|nr:uncharacterized protein LOC117245954 [Epinephelus lanceolatus]